MSTNHDTTIKALENLLNANGFKQAVTHNNITLHGGFDLNYKANGWLRVFIEPSDECLSIYKFSPNQATLWQIENIGLATPWVVISAMVNAAIETNR